MATTRQAAKKSTGRKARHHELVGQMNVNKARRNAASSSTAPPAEGHRALRASGEPPKSSKKPRRLRPGAKAELEIRKYQKSFNLLLLRLPFERLVRETAQDVIRNIRFKPEAILTIQESAENYLVDLFAFAADLAKRKAIMKKDLHLAKRRLRGD